MISNNVEASEKPLNAANSADFRRIYNETMILLFKVSWRIVMMKMQRKTLFTILT